MKDENNKVFDDPYFSQIVNIYNYLKKEYSNYDIYFSKYLDSNSVCLKTKNKIYEFYIKENSMQNNEIYLFKNYVDLPHKTSGGGCADKLDQLEKQIKDFLKDLKIEPKRITLFDLL